MSLQYIVPTPHVATTFSAEKIQLAPSSFERGRVPLDIAGSGVLLAAEAALGGVCYEITSRASHSGEWMSAGVLHAPATLIEQALRSGTLTLRDEANGVELDVIVVRHEIGACEADIMLDDDQCLSFANADLRLLQPA
jgi:hypothetical protein